MITRIKYSSFGKKYLKEEGKLYQTLRAGRNRIRRVLITLKRKLRGEKSYLNILSEFQRYLCDPKETFESEGTSETIDVIVPIYNGYEYLIRLFEDLPKTEMSCRFILVDDKSPDERVHRLEKEFAAAHDNAILLENEENVGFVGSVNRGIAFSANHVALVNTDTELPQGWPERLMDPILYMDKVASATPYTNSGTLFSFPNFCYNNRIYRGKSVETLDSYFRMLKPVYTAAPTGVGFCMGMSRTVIDQIGLFDQETFGRGFGEENDWCQRALRLGYRNVHVDNLFVYHKHGGTFVSEEKERLIEAHMDTLRKRYPSYDSQVSSYARRDPNQRSRHLVQMLIDTHEAKSVLFFDHAIGGGATSYLNLQKQKFLNDGCCVSVIRYLIKEDKYHFYFYNGDLELEYSFREFADIMEIGAWLHFDEIYINELVMYPELWETQRLILELKEQQNAGLIMLVHDFFAVCPTINLMGAGYQYCGMPEAEECERCYQQKAYDREYGCGNRQIWLENWGAFLSKCEEVRTFSQDTLRRMKEAFSDELSFTLVPHQAEYMFPIHKHVKTTDTLNIGVLGILAIHKGGMLVKALIREIRDRGVDVRVTLIGRTDDVDISGFDDIYSETGEYRIGELPRLVYENDIDLFFLASVWPETFSYTTEEIIRMGMPIVTFDLGAPAERVRAYNRGLVLEDRTPAAVLDEILNFAETRLSLPDMRVRYKKVIFLAEYVSFSSRYRMEHMREELLYQGVTGELWETDNIPKKINWDEVAAVVIYRCRYREPLKSFMEAAGRRKIRIFYDIDDFIFDYESIRDLPFMSGKDYTDYDVYCEKIAQCMRQSDALIVSTDHLQTAVKETFPDKPVMVNRNVASAEMVILSILAQRKKSCMSDRVVIGYFSGSHTHNQDFALIADSVEKFMRDHEDVYFKVVGCLELPPGLKKMEDRVICVNFVDWQELPAEIATVDINLMPLEQSFFHECKSENKWMEAALVRVPTIGSYTEEVAGATCPGEDILLCKTEEEWIAGLEQLREDAAYRRKMAENAYQHAIAQKTTLADHSGLLEFMGMSK